MRQTTIRRSIECSGIGLHSGRKVRMCLRPAPENTGILFCLRNGAGTRFLSPSPQAVVATGLATTLGAGKDQVATVEHLLAAVRGMEIDNLMIEVEGGEAPIMDGSAASFIFLLRSAGIRRQAAPRRGYALKRPFRLEQDGKWIKAEPYQGFHLDYTVDFDHPLVGRQHMSLELTPESFTRRVAKARTFGFLRDVERMQQAGFALGGSLENAVVLDEYGVLNPEGLRFQDECVRHKALDFIGDMAVLGLPLYGSFQVYCSGHGFNNAFLRGLYENREIYLEEVEFVEPQALPEPAREARPQEEGVPVLA